MKTTRPLASFKRMMDLRPTAAAYARVLLCAGTSGKLDAAIEAMTPLSTDATSRPIPRIYRLGITRATASATCIVNWPVRSSGDRVRVGGARVSRSSVCGSQKARLAEAKGDRERALAADQKVSATAPTPDVHGGSGELYGRLGRTDDAAREYALAEASWRTDAPSLRRWRAFSRSAVRKWTQGGASCRKRGRGTARHLHRDGWAWCYFKAGRLSDAASAMTRAQRTGTRDQSIRAHAAAISRALHADAGN